MVVTHIKDQFITYLLPIHCYVSSINRSFSAPKGVSMKRTNMSQGLMISV